MKNLTRAQRKKKLRQFKVGDTVTWGLKVINSEVIEVTSGGLYVKDKTFPRYFVAFDHNNKRGGVGPIYKISK